MVRGQAGESLLIALELGGESVSFIASLVSHFDSLHPNQETCYLINFLGLHVFIELIACMSDQLLPGGLGLFELRENDQR